MKTLLILGAGGHGKVVADCALETGLYHKVAFLDDDAAKVGEIVIDYPVIGKLCNFEKLKGEYDEAFVAIGNNRLRVELVDKLNRFGYNVPCLIHPFSFVSKFSVIECGTVVLAGAVINAGTRVGRGSIINTCSSVDHDCLLSKGVHISPGARVGGTVTVGDYSWICLGSSIANNVHIGENSIIAAGAAVIKDIDNNVLAAGVPAVTKKRLRQ